ncbi:MAG: hypothetical protein AAF573_05805 [Bacteroidota bacterium]
MNAPAYTLHQEEQEKKNKKRGLLIAFYFHVGLIVLGLLPFMGNMLSPDPLPEEEMTFITVDFSQQESASNKKSPVKKAKKVEKRKKKIDKPVKKEIPKVKPKPAPKVVTTPKPEPALETPQEVVEEVTEEPVVEEPIVEEVPAEVEEVEDPGTGSGEVEEAGEEMDMGSDNETSSSGKANGGDGFGESAGEGIFNRKVIYRADVKKITKLSGKIVVELCINRDGRVVFAKPDTEASTIKNFDVIRKAVNLTTKYKFARDYTAPRKQCGKMTYVFEGAGR